MPPANDKAPPPDDVDATLKLMLGDGFSPGKTTYSVQEPTSAGWKEPEMLQFPFVPVVPKFVVQRQFCELFWAAQNLNAVLAGPDTVSCQLSPTLNEPDVNPLIEKLRSGAVSR